MDYAKGSLRLHQEWKGKIEVNATVPVGTQDDLALAYTPGVAQPCLEIPKDINKSYELTRRHNLCAVITDGTAAISIAKLLSAGFRDVTLCDKFGALYEGNKDMDTAQEEIAKVTNLEKRHGMLPDMLVGADVFIGVSAPNLVTTEMVRTMAKDAIIFACANPTPEIYPDDAKAGGARVVATGRSDFPNQINNVLAFPGIFRGAFDVRARDINDEMQMAAALALSGIITDEELSEENIIPHAYDPRVVPAVAKAVAEAARRTGVARI